ncbi:MAG: hypothetical protein M3Q71_10670 [Chloroflexota bacterium]|nr:hypothetical protein [Chloroflexota bacterium]MDP9471111.1 hypothetical protein [Chloroflexota bacterium]
MDSPDPRGGVPLHEAAELLGVTVELLRKRAQRKTVPAYKVDGRWYVVLDGLQDAQDTTSPGPVRDRTGSPGQDVLDNPPPLPSTVSPAARSQLEAIRDEWLRPLVDRIGELEREAGQLQERVAGVERERDGLAARLANNRKLADQLVNVLQAERDALATEVEQLKAAQDASQASPFAPGEAQPAETASDTSVPWWRFWERWG